MKALHMIAFTLLVIGGLNWGIYGASNMQFNLVNKILGSVSWLETLVYILVGLSAILEAVSHAKNCRHCENKTVAQPVM